MRGRPKSCSRTEETCGAPASPSLRMKQAPQRHAEDDEARAPRHKQDEKLKDDHLDSLRPEIRKGVGDGSDHQERSYQKSAGQGARRHAGTARRRLML